MRTTNLGPNQKNTLYIDIYIRVLADVAPPAAGLFGRGYAWLGSGMLAFLASAHMVKKNQQLSCVESWHHQAREFKHQDFASRQTYTPEN